MFTTPKTDLARLALRHLDELPTVKQRAAVLAQAADSFTEAGDADKAHACLTTASILREAEAAQLRLPDLLQ